ncbi:MAG: Loki-CTERM sorting domain-containing protein, partial [Promethearchaeota archaeon]
KTPNALHYGRKNVDVLICVNKRPDSTLLNKIKNYGVNITTIYDTLIYAVAGSLPTDNVSALAADPDVTLIEGQAHSYALLDASTVNMGVRGSSYVWDATPSIKGNPNYSIAILDTGIDSTHPDMENLIYFRDFTDEGYPNGSIGYDYGHHGTHVASIAAGTGAADTTPYMVNETISSSFPSLVMYYWTIDWFEVRDNPNMSDTIVTLTWDNSSGGGVFFGINSSSGWVVSPANYSNNPIIQNLGNLNGGWYQVVAASNSSASVNKNYTITIDRENNYVLDQEPSNAPVYAGVAPESNLVSLKVLDDTGSGIDTWFLNALTWISNNGKNPAYNITTVSMSLAFNSIISPIDTAINNLVDEGFICVAAAGNDGTFNGNNAINSPGTAEKIITVGAVNNAFEVAYYSSNGDSVYKKPDVIAPGGTLAIAGSSSPHNLIIAADSNYNESGNIMTDARSNDYVGFQGTSMACPHVSGLAQLVIDAIIQTEGNWSWSKKNALRVKHLITMGTWEVDAGETIDWDGDGIPQNPTLDRIGRDDVEGYGMVRADAVIQAITNPTTTQLLNVSYYLDRRSGLYANESKVKLFSLNASLGLNYTFTLNVPSTGDFDLIIYDNDYDPNSGTPIVFDSSINSSFGVDEAINFIPSEDGIYYWSIRAAQGYGICQISMARSDNQPPNSPTNPTPINGTTDVSLYPTLSVDVTDPDNDMLIVSFYDASDDSLLGVDSGVPSGSTASVTWLGLAEDVLYSWYVKVNDVSLTTNSSIWAFTTLFDLPIWDQTPIDITINYGESFIYDVNASDSSGIAYYWLNETTYFTIGSTGIITNITALLPGNYWIEIRGYDPFGFYIIATIKLTVLSSGLRQSGNEIPGYDIGFLFSAILVVSTILIKKRRRIKI